MTVLGKLFVNNVERLAKCTKNIKENYELCADLLAET